MLKLQELASKYETVRRTEHTDPETGIKDIKTEVIKPKMSMEMKSKPLPPERQVKTGVLDPTMQMKKVITQDHL